MKRLLALVACLLAVALLVPCVTLEAQPRLTPHEDPATAQSTIDSYSFLLEYSQVFSYMVAEQYSNASQLSALLSHITVPADLEYIVNRYNNLTEQLINCLSNLQTTLNTASSLLNQYRLTEAGTALSNAGVLVSQAQILLSDLESATSTLSQNFGILAAPAASKERQAYNQLQNLLSQLNSLINRYHTLLNEATQKEQQIKSQDLAATTLTLSLSAAKGYVGSKVQAYGVLSYSKGGLANRTVAVLLDGNPLVNVTTGSGGSYSANITIPYWYVNSITFSAIYTPQGNDTDYYLASLSSSVSFQVLFDKTNLLVSASNTAYPDISYTVKGNVTSTLGAPLSSRQLTIALNGDTVAKTKSNPDGSFSVTFTINPQTHLGPANLTVSVSPSGAYAGATVLKTVAVKLLSTQVSVTSPSFIVLPSELEVSGSVTSAWGPLKNTTVQLQLGNMTAKTKTGPDGSFNFTLPLTFTTAIAGYKTLTVKAASNAPWLASGETQTSIFLLNSITTMLTFATSLSAVTVAYVKFGRGKGKKPQEPDVASEVSAVVVPELAVAASPTPQFKLEGNRGEVLKAYIEALKAVEAATGSSLMPEMTLREYMVQTQIAATEAAEAFAELTVMAEKSLYSTHEPDAGDIEAAKQHAATIGRILSADA